MPFSIRKSFGLLHRWAGLFIAVFLTISGITGAIISWDHELDEWLNPQLFKSQATGDFKPALDLVRSVEAADPRVVVTYFPLQQEEGHNAVIGVEPRLDPQTGQPFTVDYNQVFVDPVSGQHLGKRFWGAISLNSEDILPFLYKLHYSMHIPDFAGIDRWGYWFMGIIAVVWTIDCFVGFYLTLPSRRAPANAATGRAAAVENRRTWWERWKPAWKIKRGASTFRFNLDLHRAFGLWLWVILVIVAFSSISMNLADIVVRPIISTFATLTPDPFDDRIPTDETKAIEPALSWQQAIDIASDDARKRGWTEPPGSAFYGRLHGLYGVLFYNPGEEHGSNGMVKMLFFDGSSGASAGGRVPWEGTAADVFMQLQFPLHSGRIAGLPGRILISFIGIVVAMLSITGIIVWAKKRAARVSRRAAGPTLADAQPAE